MEKYYVFQFRKIHDLDQTGRYQTVDVCLATAGEVQATANIDTSDGRAYDLTITVSDKRNSGVSRKLTIVITGGVKSLYLITCSLKP